MKKYKIIYADPPWKYRQRGVQGACEKHYKTMSLDELKELPVPEIADKDCALFLWATFPTLPDALSLMEAWGFTYKTTAFVWLKKIVRRIAGFMGLDFGHVQMQKSVCWGPEASPNDNRRGCINLSLPRLSVTAKNRLRREKKFLHLWGTSPVWNYLPGKVAPAGMRGVTKSSVPLD